MAVHFLLLLMVHFNSFKLVTAATCIPYIVRPNHFGLFTIKKNTIFSQHSVEASVVVRTTIIVVAFVIFLSLQTKNHFAKTYSHSLNGFGTTRNKDFPIIMHIYAHSILLLLLLVCVYVRLFASPSQCKFIGSSLIWNIKWLFRRKGTQPSNRRISDMIQSFSHMSNIYVTLMATTENKIW